MDEDISFLVSSFKWLLQKVNPEQIAQIAVSFAYNSAWV